MEFYVLYFFIGLIVAVIILASENNKLKDENNKLKKELSKYRNNSQDENEKINEKLYNTAQATKNSTVSNNINTSIRTTANIQNRVSQRQVKKQKMTKEQSKNVMILISGAIFIILSAIVFLMSTWNVIPNIIKTMVFVLLIGVFLGASKIADKKLKLKMTSATFYYLAMAYIPIMLISIWGFELFGKYLSIHGDGSYIYLTLMSIVVSSIYFSESKKRKGIILLIPSSIFQILTVIFGVLIFSKNSNIVWTGLFIYSAIVSTTLYTIKKKKYRHFYINYSLVLMICLLICQILGNFENWIIAKCDMIHVINYIILICNIIILNVNKKLYKANMRIALAEILNASILFGTLTLLSIKGITLISGTKLFILSLVAIILYSLDYMKNEKVCFKVIVYILINFVLLSILLLIDSTEYAKYIPIISTIIVILSEKIKNDKEIKYYIILSFIFSFLTLNINPSIVGFVVLLCSIITYKYYVKKNSINEGWDIVPIIAITPYIFLSDIFILKNSSFNYALLISVGVIVYETAISLSKEKLNINTIMSIIYVILTIISFKINSYIKVLFFIIWSTAHIILHKNKKIYQPVLFISLLVIYLLGIKDLRINDITSVKILGFILCTLGFTRITLSKEMEAQKVIEYITFSLIYWIATYMYKSIADAMLVMAVLLSLVIIGYMEKMGPIFITSLIAIVINGFKLTKQFWLSIPWWLYLLVIGSSLILFAVNNEINQKGDKKNIIEKLKTIKEEINM